MRGTLGHLALVLVLGAAPAVAAVATAQAQDAKASAMTIVALKPGGIHLMSEGLKHPLKQGDTIAGTLTFEKAGTLPVTFKVEGVGAADPHARMTMN